MTPEEIARITGEAVVIAKANASIQLKPVILGRDLATYCGSANATYTAAVPPVFDFPPDAQITTN